MKQKISLEEKILFYRQKLENRIDELKVSETYGGAYELRLLTEILIKYDVFFEIESLKKGFIK